MAKTRKRRKRFDKIIKSKRKMRKKRNFTRKDYNSGEGMLTSVWGPSMWHYMHTMSFNYPVKPTKENNSWEMEIGPNGEKENLDWLIN